MIQLIDIAKQFGPQILFHGLSWHIRRGVRVGLVGANGAGKSTLLRILAGQQEPDDGVLAVSKGIRVGLLDQEPDFSGDRTVLQEVENANSELLEVKEQLSALESQLGDGDDSILERYGALSDKFDALGGYRAQAEAKRVLCGLGFTEAELSDRASRFSGGWRMRIALARLLLTAPDVLLLDEPSNHLDLESLAWLESHLEKYEGAVVTVSHDRWFLDRTVTQIADLRVNGVSFYTGGYDAFVQQRDEELVLLEKQKKQQDSEIKKTERFIERFRAKNTKATAVQSRVKALDKIERIELPPKIRAMRGFNFPQPGRTGRYVTELKGVTKAYGDNIVYHGLDLAIERGWKVALVGVNGAGKSTLLKVLADAVDIQAGERKLGHHVEVGYFAQHQIEELNMNGTVLGEMEQAADVETYPMVRSILGAFLFSGDDVEKPVSVLSGGEKARLALGKMLIHPRALLLLDEPTSHLDLASRDSLEDALVRFQGTVVVVSHDRYFMNAICTHVLEVSSGSVAWYPGNYDDYLWKKKQESVAAVSVENKLKKTTGGMKPVAPVATNEKKEKKRREAEQRQQIHAATKDLKTELSALETTISDAESRMKTIDERLGDPATYEEDGRAASLTLERVELEGKLELSYLRWEELDVEIEAAIQDIMNA